MEKAYAAMKHPLWLYLVLFAFFVYLFILILDFTIQMPGSLILSGLYLVEFGVHEVSHMAVFFLPPIFVAAAGSIGEIGFTVLILAVALKQRAYFAAIFAALWVMLAMHSVGQYMADARTQAIPLIGPSQTVTHDWNFVFGQLGWLEYDTTIGGAVTITGIVIGVAALLFGAYLIVWKIVRDIRAQRAAAV